MRSSAIEVHPNISEASHLRSSIPQPKTDFRKNQIAPRRIIPWPDSSTKKRFFFRNQDWGTRTASFRNKIAEMGYLFRRTGHICC